MQKVGKNIKYNTNGWKIDIYQPNVFKPGINITMMARFKPVLGIDYHKMVSRYQKNIKSVLNRLFGASIVIINIPDIIFIGKNQNIMIEYCINYPNYTTNNIKKDFVFIGELKSINKKIIDDMLNIVN